MLNHSTKLWDKLLDEAPKNSILMGGAIIDEGCGINPKDYDIFHTYKVGEPEVPPNWKMTEVDWNKPEWVEQHLVDYAQGVGPDGKKVIGSVYEYLVDDLYVVQLIGVMYENPAKHFKNFDHSLTLGRYSSKGLFLHKKVFDSINTRTIEYVGHDKSIEAKTKSLKRAELKAQRYKGYWDFIGFDA